MLWSTKPRTDLAVTDLAVTDLAVTEVVRMELAGSDTT